MLPEVFCFSPFYNSNPVRRYRGRRYHGTDPPERHIGDRSILRQVPLVTAVRLAKGAPGNPL